MYIDIMHEVSDIIVNDIGEEFRFIVTKVLMPRNSLTLFHLEINKNRTLYPAYDQIMTEELSAQYYNTLNEMMADEIDYQGFIGHHYSTIIFNLRLS